MQRSISPISLLLTSVSAILGSGWLFAAYYTSILAGPSAIFSWLMGGCLVIVIAFVFAELCSMIPVTGSSARIPFCTHGTIVSFLFAWIIWLSYASLAPTEVQAVLQYLSYFFPLLIKQESGMLTHSGYVIAIILMSIMCSINIFSLRWLLRSNNALTLLKLSIPIVISLAILSLFHFTDHVSFKYQTFFPMGLHGTVSAIAAGGIVFAFNGFKQACEMAGEAKNPQKSLPIAIIFSIVICLTVYLLLQFAFLSSIHEEDFAHGWATLYLVGNNSPFTTILASHHLSSLLTLLYVGAVIGPLAAGLMYISSASRSLYGMSKNDYLPFIFQKLTTQGSPFFAIIVNFVLGILMFLPLPGWNKMVTFLTSLMAITYAIAPICLLALREQAPYQPRPFKLPFIKLWSGFAFFICTLMIYWTGWEIISKLSIMLVIGLVILLSYHRTERGQLLTLDWRSSIWLWAYFFGISLISYLGNFGHGIDFIHFGWDFFVIAAFSLGILYLSQKYKLSSDQTQAYLNQINLNLACKEKKT